MPPPMLPDDADALYFRDTIALDAAMPAGHARCWRFDAATLLRRRCRFAAADYDAYADAATAQRHA